MKQKHELSYGTKVVITSEGIFKNAEGIVVDAHSRLSPKRGPVAIYFGLYGNEPGEIFEDLNAMYWRGETPSQHDYHDCLRVACFQKSDLDIIEEFSLQYRARELYKSSRIQVGPTNFPFVPNAHACQLLDCTSNKLATHETLYYVMGYVCNMYTCEDCYKRFHGRYGNASFPAYKIPFPGAPAQEQLAGIGIIKPLSQPTKEAHKRA